MSERIEGRPIRVGLMGHGKIGTPVARILAERGESQGLIIGGILVRDPDEHFAREGNIHQRHLFTADPADIHDNPDIDLVVELMGGIEPARTYNLNAIRNRKDLVTANKAVLAAHGKEFFDAARANQVGVGFEPSVGGKIPIMTLQRHFQGEEVIQILGVLNGTSNFILTRVLEDGVSQEDALKLAQSLGLAEPDPIRDMDGNDAADKINLLAKIFYNADFPRNRIQPIGIEQISLYDMKLAERLGLSGYSLKHLARAVIYPNGSVGIDVRPAMISRDHDLSRVRNEENGITLYTRYGDPITISGPGAGPEATSSAVWADIVRIAKNRRRRIVEDAPTLDNNIPLLDPDDSQSGWYMRVNFRDTRGVWEEYGRILKNNNLSGEHSIKGRVERGRQFVEDYDTFYGTSGDAKRAVAALQETEMVEGVPIIFPIYGDPPS